MTAQPIPKSIDDVSPAWLGAVTGFDIRAITVEQIGVGIGVSSAVYRVALDGRACPQSVVVKLPALDEAANFTSTMLRFYIREVRFFTELASQSPIRVPACYHGAVDEETSRFVVVMEDMGAMRSVDQLDGMALVDAEQAVDELAGWHATWWRRADALAESGVALSLGDPIYTAILPVVFEEGWEKVRAAMPVDEAIAEVGPRFGAAIGRLMGDLALSPTTLVHGDYRADNILFMPNGRVALLDFQIIGTGSGAYDLAYFVTQSLDAQVAHDHERELFDRWVDGLRRRGVSEDDTARMWQDYRTAALFCLVYPIVASRGMDLSDRRQYELVMRMNSRMSRALTELDLAELL